MSGREGPSNVNVVFGPGVCVKVCVVMTDGGARVRAARGVCAEGARGASAAAVMALVSVWSGCDRSRVPPGVRSRCACEGVCGFEIAPLALFHTG